MVSSKLAERFNLLEYVYAHRGLWEQHGPPENSLEAFEAAAEAGIGLELDVRPSADGTPICFHDPLLDRVTSESGLVCQLSAEELDNCHLANGEPIPLFSDILAIFPAQLPILVEIKIDGDTDPQAFARTVIEMVETHAGKAAIMSFNEQTVDMIPETIMRGQLIHPSSLIGEALVEEKIQRAQRQSVDYLGLHVSNASYGPNTQLPVVCWTVRTLEQRQTVQALGFTEIYEHLPVPLAAQ